MLGQVSGPVWDSGHKIRKAHVMYIMGLNLTPQLSLSVSPKLGLEMAKDLYAVYKFTYGYFTCFGLC